MKSDKYNDRTARIKIIYIGLLFVLFSGCTMLQTSGGEKIKPFSGTIIYSIDVQQNVDTTFVKNKKAVFGTEMYLTVFKNGDIQRKYKGNSPTGYDLHYINLEDNQVLEKYNNSDSLFVHSAAQQDMTKMNELRVTKEQSEVLGISTEQIAIAAKEVPSSKSIGDYLTIKYWYSPTVRVDKSKYSNVNDELWSYFMNKSDGSLYLKYEIDYFSYKVTYTATQILPGKYEKYKDELSEEAPRVTE